MNLLSLTVGSLASSVILTLPQQWDNSNKFRYNDCGTPIPKSDLPFFAVGLDMRSLACPQANLPTPYRSRPLNSFRRFRKQE